MRGAEACEAFIEIAEYIGHVPEIALRVLRGDVEPAQQSRGLIRRRGELQEHIF